MRTAPILRHAFTGKGVDVTGVFEDPMRMTSKKTRVLASNQQIVRIDRETREDISPEFEEKILAYVGDRQNVWDIILISDYGKGLLTPRVLSGVIGCREGAGHSGHC